MKFITILCLMSFSVLTNAETFNLKSGEATYTVRHKFKKVEGTSKNLKGKIQCQKKLCEFLIAVHVDTFLSSDSNRDLNMQSTLDTSKYPIAVAKGTFPLQEWSQPKSTITAEVDFHGVKKQYLIKLTSAASGPRKADLDLDLEAHKIERPSLFTMKIDNIVPVQFELNWHKEEK